MVSDALKFDSLDCMTLPFQASVVLFSKQNKIRVSHFCVINALFVFFKYCFWGVQIDIPARTKTQGSVPVLSYAERAASPASAELSHRQCCTCR